jgi:hypothetical protein
MVEMLLEDLMEAYDILEKEGTKAGKEQDNPTLLY